MIKYCKEYIKRHYEHFRFFRPECKDYRIREVMMRNRLCFECPGLERCRMHPEFWLEGQEDRDAENIRLMKKYPKQEELTYLPEDIIEDTGVIEIKTGIPEVEKKLGI